MYHTDYTNRGIKEIAYTEIATSLDTIIPAIKTKITAWGPFYFEEKLSQLDKRDRRIAEKCISDILFEIEMSVNMSADEEVNR